MASGRYSSPSIVLGGTENHEKSTACEKVCEIFSVIYVLQIEAMLNLQLLQLFFSNRYSKIGLKVSFIELRQLT